MIRNRQRKSPVRDGDVTNFCRKKGKEVFLVNSDKFYVTKTTKMFKPIRDTLPLEISPFLTVNYNRLIVDTRLRDDLVNV